MKLHGRRGNRDVTMEANGPAPQGGTAVLRGILLLAGALAAMSAFPVAAFAGGEEVRFTTSDRIVISGTFYASAKSGSPAVLCLHQWRSDRSGFNPIVPQLVKAGFNVLVIDMRGNGASDKTSDGKAVEPDRIASKDVEAAVGFLRGRSSVDPGRIGIMGASYGASNAIIYAAGDARIRALVLLSPGMNYFNVLPVEPAARKYGTRPLYVLASSEDVRSVDAVTKISAMNPSTVKKLVLENCGHGTEMLPCDPAVIASIITFFTSNL